MEEKTKLHEKQFLKYKQPSNKEKLNISDDLSGCDSHEFNLYD
jgi:hypothetical protein